MRPTTDITEDMFSQAQAFGEAVLNDTYDRFRKDKRTRFERIYVGKLGEMVVSKYLVHLDIEHDTTTMFEVFEGVENADPFDFAVPSTEETIDVKTAYRPNHSRIMVPCGPTGQWHQMPKDYYVGVKL